MPHIDDGTLHALLDGALRTEAPEEAAAAEAHLARCDDCRARLDEAAALRDAATAILAPPPGAGDAVPDFDEVVARSRTYADAAVPAPGSPDPAMPERRRRQLAWTRRAAWAATLVLALGTGYLIRDLAGPAELATGSADAPAAGRAAEPGVEPALPEREEAPAPDRAAEAGSPGQPVSGDAPGSGRTAQKAAEEREVAESEAVVPEAAPQPAPAAALAAGARGAEAGAVEGSGRWAAATVDEAAAGLGGALYLLPRAELVEVYLAEGPGGPAVLSIQRLATGVPVRVVQRRTPEAEADLVEEPARAAGAVDPVAPGDRAVSLRAAGEGVSRAATPPSEAGRPALPPPETAQVVVDGFVLELTASLPADLLAILGTAARPVPR